jgi:DNA-binding CsgD family transcriptional regulator
LTEITRSGEDRDVREEKMDEARLHAAIGEIYERALDPGRGQMAGRVIEDALGIGSSIHFVSEGPRGRMVRLLSASENFDEDARRDYAAYYHDRNVWFQRALPHPPPFVRRGEELIEQDDFLRTEFCADWCPRVDIFHMIGCTYPLPGGLVGGSGVHRTRRQGAFSDTDKRLYAVLMGHFARAVGLSMQLGPLSGQTAIAPEIVEALDLGVILVEEDRRIVQANRVGAAVLGKRRWLTVADGRLRTVHQGSLGLLAWRIAAAARAGAGKGLDTGTVLRLSAPGGAALPVLVSPFRSSENAWGLRRPTAAVLFRDPSSSAGPRADAIAATYGLSPAEARLVARLGEGKTLIEAARSTGISLNTAKTQLSSVFARTGFSRQADLLADVRANPLLRILGD